METAYPVKLYYLSGHPTVQRKQADVTLHVGFKQTSPIIEYFHFCQFFCADQTNSKLIFII